MHTPRHQEMALNYCIIISACDGRAKYSNLSTGGQLISSKILIIQKHKSVLFSNLCYVPLFAWWHATSPKRPPPISGHFDEVPRVSDYGGSTGVHPYTESVLNKQCLIGITNLTCSHHFAAPFLQTVCVEKNATLGGTCLNVGCIPSKVRYTVIELFVFLGKIIWSTYSSTSNSLLIFCAGITE